MRRTLLAAWLSVPALALAAQGPTFRSGVDVVRVDVLATDNGRPIPGLGAEDFEVLDRNVVQRVDLISSAGLPVNVVLGLDMSDSVNDETFRALREACDAVIAALAKDDQAGLVTFSSGAALRSPLTRDAAGLRAGLVRPDRPGETALVDAGYAAIAAATADTGRALAVLFTDGVDTSSVLRPEMVLGIAKRADVVVYGVTPANVADIPFLNDVTKQTGGRVLRAASAADVRGRLLAILDEFRHRYVLSYRPEGVDAPGWHPLKVRLKTAKGSVSARTGYER